MTWAGMFGRYPMLTQGKMKLPSRQARRAGHRIMADTVAHAAMEAFQRREEACVDLGLSMVPETSADAVALLSLIARSLDEAGACDLEKEELEAIARTALRALRCALPVLAEAAGIDLDDLSASDRTLCALARETGA